MHVFCQLRGGTFVLFFFVLVFFLHIAPLTILGSHILKHCIEQRDIFPGPSTSFPGKCHQSN